MFKKKPKSEFTVSEESNTYNVLLYRMQTGTETKTGTNMNPTTGAMNVYTYESPVTEDYIFLFYDNKLFYWGFLNELGKSEDELIVNLGPKINEKIKQSKK